MDFKSAVYLLVKAIPSGKVMTYGQIAALLGRPRAAQYVGWTLHWSNQDEVPYQRVVNRFGEMAPGYTTGGRLAHKQDLEREGVEVREDMTIDLEKYLWHPNPEQVPTITEDQALSDISFSAQAHR